MTADDDPNPRCGHRRGFPGCLIELGGEPEAELNENDHGMKLKVFLPLFNSEERDLSTDCGLLVGGVRTTAPVSSQDDFMSM